MKTSLCKLILLTGIFSGAVVLNSCSKEDAVNSISAPSATSLNSSTGKIANAIFDRDLLIPYAKDDGTDITANFNGITFHIYSGSEWLSGYATAANDLLAVNGTWSMNNDRTRITFNFPTNLLRQLSFMNKEWDFQTFIDPIILTAANGENDEVHFVGKK